MNQGSKSNKLLLDLDTSQDNSAYDDNLSENNKIIRIGGQSEYS
jgi:hypothetical protein